MYATISVRKDGGRGSVVGESEFKPEETGLDPPAGAG